MSYRVSSKTFVSALLCASWCLSCGEAKKVEVTDSHLQTPIAAEPAEAFIAGMHSYSSQDLTKLLGIIHKDAVWSNMTAVSNRLEGRTAVANQLLVERGIFPDCAIGLSTLLESGQKLAVLGVFKGTHRAPIHGFAATGKEVRYPFLYFVDMSAGQILSNTAYFNPIIAARQIGAVKSKIVRAADWPGTDPLVVKGAAPPEVEGAVRQLVAAMEKGDAAAIGALVSEGVTLIDPSLERFEGRQAVSEALTRGASAFEGLKIPVDQLISAGRFAAVSLVMQGTFTFAGQDPPLRKALDIPGAMFVELKEGHIDRVQLITDEMLPLAQLGLPTQVSFGVLGDELPTETSDTEQPLGSVDTNAPRQTP
jgi:predicted ester cyclase